MSVLKKTLTSLGIIFCICLIAVHILDSIEFIHDPTKYMIGAECMIDAGGMKYASNSLYLASNMMSAIILLTTLCLYFAKRNGYILLGGIALWFIVLICL